VLGGLRPPPIILGVLFASPQSHASSPFLIVSAGVLGRTGRRSHQRQEARSKASFIAWVEHTPGSGFSTRVTRRKVGR